MDLDVEVRDYIKVFLASGEQMNSFFVFSVVLTIASVSRTEEILGAISSDNPN